MFEGKPLAAKLTAIGLIVLGLMIPLSMLRGLILERSQMRNQAVETVAKGWGGSLTVGGLMLRVPFDVENKSNTGEISKQSHQLFILANDLDIQATIDHTTTRRIGIYGVPVYVVRAKLSGTCKMTDVMAAAALGPYPNAIFRWKESSVRLPLSDVRSVREFSSARLGQRSLPFGPALAVGLPGVEAGIDLSEFFHAQDFPFSPQLGLAAILSFGFFPPSPPATLNLPS